MMESLRESKDSHQDEYQRMMWEMLRKSINGIINKVNISNIQNIIYEIFNENLLKGKGILVRAIIKAQMASPNFTHVYSALVSVINTKLPDIGALTIKRYILQFQKAYKRNNKIVCTAAMKMLAHLVNQEVSHETLAFEILFLFLESPTEDSVELACEFMTECGQVISEKNPPLTHSIFERFRGILHEGEIDKRIQYTIENLFAIRKTNFKDHPGVITELDLVSDEDKNIHPISLDDELDPEDNLDLYKFDKNYEENESLWIEMKGEILGVDGAKQTDLDMNIENQDNQENLELLEENNQETIQDLNELDLQKLRRTIYLTIISSVDFQECCHKLLKLNMIEGQEMELINMIIQCCIQERTYLRFYGLLSERLCMIKEVYKICFEKQFEAQYDKIHRLETNKLRNLAKLFAHLLYTDSIDWSVFIVIKLTEEDTTSSSRIFIKIIFQELAEHLGMQALNDRLQDPMHRDKFLNVFSRDNPKNTRFSINFFTSIGLGALTENLREFLANAEKMIEDQKILLKTKILPENLDVSEEESSEESESGESSSENSSSSSSSNSGSSSSSESESKSSIKKKK